MFARHAPFPFAGLVALSLALLTLAALAAILAAPTAPAVPYDPTDPAEMYMPRAREARAARRHHERVELGVGVLGVGSALAGWAALSATRRGGADRFLAGVAGACCLAGAILWLAIVVRGLTGTGDSDDRGPALVVEYDDH
jgi:hypothetical protein